MAVVTCNNATDVDGHIVGCVAGGIEEEGLGKRRKSEWNPCEGTAFNMIIFCRHKSEILELRHHLDGMEHVKRA